MIDTSDLNIINYCHPNCKPFQNIMRLPKEQAFKKQKSWQKAILEPRLFYRFAKSEYNSGDDQKIIFCYHKERKIKDFL